MFAFSCRPKTDAHFRRVATLHDNTADRQAETCNTHSHDWPRLQLTSLESHNSGTSGNWVWARARVPGQTAATRATNVIDQKCNAWLPRNRTTAIPEWFFEVDQGSFSWLFDTLLQGNQRECYTWHSKSPMSRFTAGYTPATTPIHSLAHLFCCFFSAYAYLWLWPFGFAGLCVQWIIRQASTQSTLQLARRTKPASHVYLPQLWVEVRLWRLLNSHVETTVASLTGKNRSKIK